MGTTERGRHVSDGPAWHAVARTVTPPTHTGIMGAPPAGYCHASPAMRQLPSSLRIQVRT
jgi:hypothetical protein